MSYTYWSKWSRSSQQMCHGGSCFLVRLQFRVSRIGGGIGNRKCTKILRRGKRARTPETEQNKQLGGKMHGARKKERENRRIPINWLYSTPRTGIDKEESTDDC